MERLKTVIYSLEDLGMVKNSVSRLSKTDIEKPDKDGLDILHHTIFVNYGEVVRYLLLRGYFTASGFQGHAYLHLSCLLGHATIANILLEYRPGDYNARSQKKDIDKWEALQRSAAELMPNCPAEDQPHISQVRATLAGALSKLQTYKDNFLPLDLAAAAGHLVTVKLFLSSKHCGFALTSLVESAVKLNSPLALTLLLAEEEHDQADLNLAFVAALKRKEAECMKILLQHGVDIGEALNGLNAYHVLYMYSSAFRAPSSSSSTAGIELCSSILLSFKHNVNAELPLCSYPLYSLIYSLVQEKDQDPSVLPVHHLKTLKILLEGGADPNFNEVDFSAICPEDSEMAVGRELFTSALNALFMSLQASGTWRCVMNRPLEESLGLLLEHGAKTDVLDSYGETPLHDLMKLWAMQHTTGNMHVDLSNMILQLLKYGANPNLKSSNGLYAVHYYFKIIFNLMGGHIAFNRWKAFNKVKKVLHLLEFMDADCASEAYKLILSSSLEVPGPVVGLPRDIVNYLLFCSRNVMCEPKTLKYLTQKTIWVSVRRNQDFVNLLPLPKRLMSDLLSVFDPNEDQAHVTKSQFI